jgi:predicted alpha/beta-fold hydrolase
MSRLSGHLWTVGVRALRGVGLPALPPSVPWSTTLDDPDVGPVRLSGQLHRFRPEAGGTLAVVLHGLGGTADSGYVHAAAVAAADSGLAALLRLAVRGADRSGEDFFHAGLTADVHAALADPALAGYDRVVVLGYSLGGHLALRYATEPGDPRLSAVAAVSAPLDLALAAAAIDAPGMGLYRRYLLTHLFDIYDAVAARRAVPTPPAVVRRTRGIRAFDELTVAPRFGFADAGDYYARASVGPRLAELRVPALLVASPDDPMVPASTYRHLVEPAPPRLTVRWVRGGHVAFPRRVPLGLTSGESERGGGSAGVDRQILAWLQAAG